MDEPFTEDAPAWLEWLRKHIWVISFVFGAIAITAVYPFMRRIPDPPPVMFTLPSTWGALVDHRGEPFAPETMRGKVWIAGFIFTRCPSSCPAVTRAMLDLRARLDRNGIDVDMVSFSVDPTHDTPEVLARYAQSVGAEHPHWRFVTGPRADIEALMGEGFKLGLGDPMPSPGGLFDIAHSTKLALIDELGGIRGYYGAEAGASTDELYERADRVWMETQRRPPVWERGWRE